VAGIVSLPDHMEVGKLGDQREGAGW
jgi:hypothetical protein